MVIRVDAESGSVQHSGHVVIPSCVFPKAVGYLNHRFGASNWPLVKGNGYTLVVFECSFDW
jgi:hypothetical protein